MGIEDKVKDELDIMRSWRKDFVPFHGEISAENKKINDEMYIDSVWEEYIERAEEKHEPKQYKSDVDEIISLVDQYNSITKILEPNKDIVSKEKIIAFIEKCKEFIGIEKNKHNDCSFSKKDIDDFLEELYEFHIGEIK